MSPFLSVTPLPEGSSVNPNTPIGRKVVSFTQYERKGVIIMATAGVTSCVFVSTLLLCIVYSAVSPWPKRLPGSPPPFTSRQIAVFIICLLVSDLLQSVSGVTQVKWAMENQIYEGLACSIQAAALVVGDLGSTLWSCVIAAHTFSGLALGKQWPRWVVYVIVITGWVFLLLLAAIPPLVHNSASKGPFFSIAGTWCFISSEYAIARLGIHYIPLFIATIVLSVFYSLVFFVLRGSISFGGKRVHPSAKRPEDIFLRDRIVIAKRMLWYPFAYLTCILPIAIIRLVGLQKGSNIPESVWIFGMFFLYALGAVDSVVYATTRTLIKPFKISTNMRTFNSNSDITNKGSIIVSRNSHTLKRPSASIDCSTYAPKTPGASDEDLGDHSPSLKRPEPLLDPRRVHITLERVEEVM